MSARTAPRQTSHVAPVAAALPASRSFHEMDDALSDLACSLTFRVGNRLLEVGLREGTASSDPRSPALMLELGGEALVDVGTHPGAGGDITSWEIASLDTAIAIRDALNVIIPKMASVLPTWRGESAA